MSLMTFLRRIFALPFASSSSGCPSTGCGCGASAVPSLETVRCPTPCAGADQACLVAPDGSTPCAAPLAESAKNLPADVPTLIEAMAKLRHEASPEHIYAFLQALTHTRLLVGVRLQDMDLAGALSAKDLLRPGSKVAFATAHDAAQASFLPVFTGPMEMSLGLKDRQLGSLLMDVHELQELLSLHPDWSGLLINLGSDNLPLARAQLSQAAACRPASLGGTA